MTRLLVALCALLVAAPSVNADPRGLVGSWTASASEQHSGLISLSMQTGHHQHDTSDFDRTQFSGLSSDQMNAATATPVRFELRREAGTIAFAGTFREGEGAGQFTFVPNREFPATLRSLGVDFDAKRGEEDEKLYELAVFDLTSDFIRSMQAIGYKVALDKYVEFRIFKVDPAYVRALAGVGFDRLPADKLVETRIQNVSPEYIRQMRAAGNDLTLDQYVQSRIFQITPEFAQEMSRLGYPRLDNETLVQFRIHDVSAEFIHQIRDLGYAHVPPPQLIDMRIHGVTPEFIRRVAAAGYHGVPVEKLVQMRIFGVDPEMVKALDQDGR